MEGGFLGEVRAPCSPHFLSLLATSLIQEHAIGPSPGEE